MRISEILPGITATTLKTPHTKESLALRLKDDDSKLFVYTSDTGFSGRFGTVRKTRCLAADGMFFQEKQTCAEAPRARGRNAFGPRVRA